MIYYFFLFCIIEKKKKDFLCVFRKWKAVDYIYHLWQQNFLQKEKIQQTIRGRFCGTQVYLTIWYISTKWAIWTILYSDFILIFCIFTVLSSCMIYIREQFIINSSLMQERKWCAKLSEYKSAVKRVNFPPQAKEVQYLMRISLDWRRDKAIFLNICKTNTGPTPVKRTFWHLWTWTSFNAGLSSTCLLCLDVCNSS